MLKPSANQTKKKTTTDCSESSSPFFVASSLGFYTTSLTMGPQEVFDGTAIESATTPNFPNLERGGTKILSVQPLNEDSQDAGLDFGTPEQRRTLPAAKGRSNPEPGAAKLRPSAFVPGVLQASRKDQSQSN